MKPPRENRTILDWIKIFGEIYSVPDSKRTPEVLWIGTMAHCSAIGEAIRRINFNDLLKSATHAFCWMCSYVKKCNDIKGSVFSLEDCLSGIVALKYPNLCGHCFESPCHCVPAKMDAKSDKPAIYEKLLEHRKKVGYEKLGISQWQATFNEIYGNHIHMLTLESIGFHFLEEVGEAALSVRMLDQLKSTSSRIVDKKFLKEVSTIEGIINKNSEHYEKVSIDYSSKQAEKIRARIVDAKIHMVIEIADTFSWFCSILNKVKSISDVNGMKLPSFEERLKEEYIKADGSLKCPTCNNSRCSCVFFT